MAWKFLIHHLSFIIRKSRGFTLVELAVVTSIFVTLLGFITITLVRSQQTASLTSVEEILLADLREQSIKSMIGDTEGRSTSDSYGIHFDQTKYTLFHRVYSVVETSNSVTNLPDTINFNAESRPEIIFEKITGEIYQFSSGVNKIILQDTTNGDTKTIIFNRYGVITEIN